MDGGLYSSDVLSMRNSTQGLQAVPADCLLFQQFAVVSFASIHWFSASLWWTVFSESSIVCSFA